MMTFKNLPLYRIVVDPNDPESGMTCISMVDSPAIQTDFLCFEKEKKMAFAVQDADKHIVTGPAIIANMPIYRYSPQLNEYYVVFDEETIDNIILKYSKLGLWNEVSLQHDGHNINSAIMIEFYKKDSKTGIVPKEYEDVADGSLFVSYKITDEELWNQIKNGDDIKGFSIEITADLEATDEQIDDGQEEDDEFQELLDLLEELGIDVLFEDQKKKFDKNDWDIINEAIDKDQELEIKVGDKTVKGYPYTTWTRDGSKNVAVYDGRDWNIINNSNIDSVKTTGNKGDIDWAQAIAKPGFDWVQKNIDDAADVKNILPTPKNDYERAVIEHKIAMVTYVDEVGRQTGVCVGNRQVGVFELGYTRAGNACMRVYQYFGPTHHTDDPIPAWRNLLYSRIRSFKIVDWMDPLTVAPMGFNETGPDRDNFNCTLRSDLKVG